MRKLSIVILEDDARRALHFRERLVDRFPYDIRIFAGRTQEMLDWLDSHLEEAVLISLDHDLNLLPGSDGQLFDPGCGRDVSTYLASRTPVCPVVIHSTNVPAATAMQSELEQAGWKVIRMTPYGDLEWVDEAWFPAIRAAILDSAVARAPIAPIART